LLPLRPETEDAHDLTGMALPARPAGPSAAYIYEPSQEGLLDVIVPRFTALQVYQAILEAAASEYFMVALHRFATDSAEQSPDHPVVSRASGGRRPAPPPSGPTEQHGKHKR
jgi:F-type H+-transporting ATPase subunit gamma